MRSTLKSAASRWGPLVIILTAFTFGLNAYPLLDPDEGRNAEVAREMVTAGDYVVPRLNGLPYADKPVLYFAAVAASMKAFGRGEWAARLPSLAFTLASLGVVWLLAASMFDRPTARRAALATATMPLTLAFARTVIFDAALTCFVLLALLGFYRAVEAPERDSRWTVLAWCAMALGVLTKGPIGLGIPLLVCIPYAWWRKRMSALVDLVAVLGFVALLLPWLLRMVDAAPGFLGYALLTETAARFATDELKRTAPVWYFIPIVAAGALPWSAVVIAAAVTRLRSARRPWDNRFVFLGLWVVVPFLFFTLSQSKRPQYVLPLMSAFGIAAAALWPARDRRVLINGAAGVLTLVGVTLLLAPVIVPVLLQPTSEVERAIPTVAVILGGVTLLAGVGAFLLASRPHAAFGLFMIPVLLIPFVSTRLMAAIGDHRSTRDLAAAIAEHARDADVYAVHTFPPSLPYYLDRTITVGVVDGRELTSNYIAHTLGRWSGVGSALRPAHEWLDRVEQCPLPTVFVARHDNRDAVRVLDDQLPHLASNDKYAVYGPCRSTDLASHAHLDPRP